MISSELGDFKFLAPYGNLYFMYNQYTKIFQFIVKFFTVLETKKQQ